MSIRALITLALSVLLATLVAASLVPPSDVAAAQRPAVRPVNQVPKAKALARALSSAKTDGARAAALTKLFVALDIGIVARNGRPIHVPSAFGAQGQFHLYDFEVRALASQYGRKDRRTLDELSTSLTKAGLTLAPGKPFPSALLHTSLRGAIRGARRTPTNRRALLALVVHELGLRRGQDLARVGASTVRLDAVQAWLVAADIELEVLLPIAQQRPATRRGRDGRAGPTAAEVCDRFNKLQEAAEKESEKAYGGKYGKWAADKASGYIYDQVSDQLIRSAHRWSVTKAPKWVRRSKSFRKGIWRGAQAAEVASKIQEALHGMLLAYSIEVKSIDDELRTHYGHAGPGIPITFRVRVSSKDDYGELAAKCGKLAGAELPRKGGIEGVPVLWEAPQGELSPRHGTLACPAGALVCSTKTGADGIASIVFTPHEEMGPAIGTEREDTGVLNGIALYQSGLDSGLPGQVAQFLTPKLDGSRWFVRYHKPRGIRIVGNWKWEDTSVGDWHNGAIDVQQCGTDVLAGPFKGQMRLVGNEGTAHGTFDEQKAVEFTFTAERKAQVPVFATGMWLPKRMHLLSLDQADPARVEGRVEYGSAFTSFSWKLDEAVDCPEPAA